MRLKLVANEIYEKAILEFLEKEASDNLVERINYGTKTLKDCMQYIKAEARNQAKDGCAIIEDAVVYGWAIHFFEEDSIKPTVKNNYVPEKKAEDKKVEKKPEIKKAPSDGLAGQMNIMDFLGV